MNPEKHIQFYIGEKQHTVNTTDVKPETTLNDYLRNTLHLYGTKKMCLEGGCGACVVSVEETNSQGVKRTFAVNSCLVSMFSCHGWRIQTIEGIGNPVKGYHNLQHLLADNNGTQCGFCSPGMIMNTYALTQGGPVSVEELESAYGGHICRCTGYRPILAAFRKIASNKVCQDIEDMENLKLCKQKDCSSEGKCSKKCAITFQSPTSRWIKVYGLKDLLQILKTNIEGEYMLVAGNTAKGVYWQTTLPNLYIDVTGVDELNKPYLIGDTLVLGGNMTLTATLKLFYQVSKHNKKFLYLAKMAAHINLVAHVAVRNIGTLAGNLMIKYQHKEFPSDIFLILETVNATLVIVDPEETEIRTTPADFLNVDMKNRVIKQIILNGMSDNSVYGSYKPMIRAQNTHALVNAGFLLQMDGGTVKSARIVFGNISTTFVHAVKTEEILRNSKLFDNGTLSIVLNTLAKEILPELFPEESTPEFRKQLAVGLFYKFVLSIAPSNKLSPRNRSGGSILNRPLSKGEQSFQSDSKKYPLSQPITKVEALAQTSGQAQYILDLPDLPEQLHAALVCVEAPPGSTVVKVDSSKALKMEGVVAFYDYHDIPGVNTFTPKSAELTVQEKLFCEEKVQFYSQPLGIIVAETHDASVAAAAQVKIMYNAPKEKPLLTIRNVLDAKRTDRIQHMNSMVPKSKGKNVKQIIRGEVNLEGQYHYHMETQNCLVVPTEDGLNIYPGTQWMDLNQCAASEALNIPSQKINVEVRRLGGGFGAKITRNAQISTAAALAAYKLQKPVKLWMPFHHNIQAIGKRFPVLAQYEAGTDDHGVIQYLTVSIYTDIGVGGNEDPNFLQTNLLQNCYVTDTWTVDTYFVTTDTVANTWCRAPGSVEGLAIIESIMEDIAHTINLNAFAVKMANIDKTAYPKVTKFLGDLQVSADIEKRRREIDEFNQENRWKKRGLSIVPMAWRFDVVGQFSVLVSIYHGDGGVAVSHGGIEMGQGINTKVAQVCAYKFGISVDKISVKPSNILVGPNCSPTGGSLTSEAVCYGIITACDTLLERMKPIKVKNPTASWVEIIKKCFNSNIQLTAGGYYSESDRNIKEYPIFAVCAAEVEVDILTGQHENTRVDIIEDVGDSMSPLIDIGQMEGGFVMGLGYYTTEQLKYDDNGRLLNYRTWNYKPPGAKDIPADFRIRFPDNNPNPVGILKSKAIAEPPTCLSVSIPIAIRHAVASARKDANPKKPKWYQMDGPTTAENILLNTLNGIAQFTL